MSTFARPRPRPRLLASAVARLCLVCLGLTRCGEALPPALESAAPRPAWASSAAPASPQALDAWLDPAMWQVGGHMACDSSPSAAGGQAATGAALPACQHLHQMLPLRAAAALCRASGGGYAPDWGLCHCPADSWFVVGAGCQAMPIAGNLDPGCPASLGALLLPGWEKQAPKGRHRTAACLKHLTLGRSAWRVGDDITAASPRRERLLGDLLQRLPSSWSTCVGPPAPPQQAVPDRWLVTSPDAAGLAAALANISPAEAAGGASSAPTRVVFWEPSQDSRKGPSVAVRERACRRALASLGMVAGGPPEGRLPSQIFGDLQAEAEGPDETEDGRSQARTDPQEEPANRQEGPDSDKGEAEDGAQLEAEAEVAGLLGASANHPGGQLERLATALKSAAAGSKKMPAWRAVSLHPDTPSVGLETVVAQPMENQGPLPAQLQWLLQEGAVLQRRLHLRDASMEMVAFLAADGRLIGVAARALPAPRSDAVVSDVDGDGHDNGRDVGVYRLWSPDFQPLMETP